jgi:Flp pilus assembly CpaF family ATPase
MSDHAPKRGIEKIIGEAVDLIVCIERVPGGRRISSIHAVVEYDGKSEDYKLVPEELINPDDEE